MANCKDDASIKLKEAKDLKLKGTKFFKDGDYIKAIEYYQKILDTFEDGDIIGHNETECKDLVQAGRLNIALCWMKLEVW